MAKSIRILIIILVVIAGGVGLGYGIFYGKNKASKNDPLIIDAEDVAAGRAEDGSDNPEGAMVPSEGESDEVSAQSYEGSPAEAEAARSVSDEGKKSLENSVGDDGYVNTAYGFAFIPPKGWYADQINSPIGQFISYTNFNPEKVETRAEDAGLVFEAVVQGNTNNQSLDEWVEEGHTYMTVISSAKIKIGEYDAYKEEVDYEGGMSLITVVKDQDVFSFSLSGKGYEDNKDIFEDISKSLIIL